jgi:hypothetical protein
MWGDRIGEPITVCWSRPTETGVDCYCFWQQELSSGTGECRLTVVSPSQGIGKTTCAGLRGMIGVFFDAGGGASLA